MSQLKRKFNHIVSKEHNCEEEEWDEYCYNKENSHPNRRIITESLNEPCVEIIKKKRGSDAENVPTNQYEEIFVEDKAVDDLASFSSKTSKLREGNISKFNESIHKKQDVESTPKLPSSSQQLFESSSKSKLTQDYSSNSDEEEQENCSLGSKLSVLDADILADGNGEKLSKIVKCFLRDNQTIFELGEKFYKQKITRAMFVSHQVLISERIIEPAVPNKIRKLLLRCSTCQDFQKILQEDHNDLFKKCEQKLQKDKIEKNYDRTQWQKLKDEDTALIILSFTKEEFIEQRKAMKRQVSRLFQRLCDSLFRNYRDTEIVVEENDSGSSTPDSKTNHSEIKSIKKGKKNAKNEDEEKDFIPQSDEDSDDSSGSDCNDSDDDDRNEVTMSTQSINKEMTAYKFLFNKSSKYSIGKPKSTVLKMKNKKIIFSPAKIQILFGFRKLFPDPNHITCIVGNMDLYLEIMEKLASHDSCSNMKTIVFLVPANFRKKVNKFSKLILKALNDQATELSWKQLYSTKTQYGEDDTVNDKREILVFASNKHSNLSDKITLNEVEKACKDCDKTLPSRFFNNTDPLGYHPTQKTAICECINAMNVVNTDICFEIGCGFPYFTFSLSVKAAIVVATDIDEVYEKIDNAFLSKKSESIDKKSTGNVRVTKSTSNNQQLKLN